MKSIYLNRHLKSIEFCDEYSQDQMRMFLSEFNDLIAKITGCSLKENHKREILKEIVNRTLNAL